MSGLNITKPCCDDCCQSYYLGNIEAAITGVANSAESDCGTIFNGSFILTAAAAQNISTLTSPCQWNGTGTNVWCRRRYTSGGVNPLEITFFYVYNTAVSPAYRYALVIIPTYTVTESLIYRKDSSSPLMLPITFTYSDFTGIGCCSDLYITSYCLDPDSCDFSVAEVTIDFA